MGSIARTIGYADTTAPTAPTLSLTAQGTDALLASWTPATDTGTGVRYYRLYVGTTAGTLALTETFSRATTAWLISGIAAQSTRYARVEAVDGAGNVSSSAVVSGTTQAQGTGGALAFAQPNPVSYSSGQTVSLALSQYVTGGGATKLYHRMSGSLPGDLTLTTATGAITGTARQTGAYSATLRVTDTTADALEADWIARSTAPGVKWAHDFRSDAEVSKFRRKNTDGVNQVDSGGNFLVRRITSDAITGSGCLEYFTPAGVENTMRWARPFNALPGDAGYVSGQPDLPADWDNAWADYRRGLYGHQDYHANSSGGFDGIRWDGTDFYIQFAYKVSASAFTGQPAGYTGKLAFIDVCGGNDAELVIQSPVNGAKRFWMYTNFGSSTNSYLGAVQSSTNVGAISQQPGGDYATVCNYDADSTLAQCWQWPTGEWVTVLIHIVPGHHSPGTTYPDMSSVARRKDTGIEVWVARANATSYTKIWEKFDYTWFWSPTTGPDVYGFNLFQPSQYMNGVSATADWYRRFTQVIFSTRYIPCPQVARP